MHRYREPMRRILLPAALLVAALSLAGCATSSFGGASDESAGSASEAQSAPETGGDAMDFSGEASAVDRQIVTTGYATITVDEPADAATEVATLVERAGGRVDSRTEYAPDDTNGERGSAELTLRIPATALTSTIESLKKLGDVQEISLSSEDVTTESQDLDARISALRESVDRLTSLLASAKDTKVLIELETAISDRQGNLESMEAQQRLLADQVAMSTVSLTLVSTADAPVKDPDTFWSGLGTGWSSLVTFFSGVLVVAGVLLPWIVLVGLVALVARVVVLRVLRKRQAAAVAAAPTD